MEKAIVTFLMQGYGVSDVADYLGHARQTTDTMFDRAVEKIVARNNQLWTECYADRPMAEFSRWRK